jgi:glycosyltransferase involved in cell wall biosynthesis
MQLSAMTGPRVLYIVYWGAAEPLGQSLVLPAVKRLAALGARITLVTFEKPLDLARPEQIAAIASSLKAHGIRWILLHYHQRPKVPATAYDVALGVARGIAASAGTGFDIVHARTFIGGLAGFALAPLVGAKFLYHNEGFYPDEQVDGGVWTSGSLPHRVAKSLERTMYERADALIVLSQRAQAEVEQIDRVQRRATPIAVVPSCVDVDQFTRSVRARPDRDGLRLVYIGSIGLRYRLDMAARFAKAAMREFGSVQLEVLTQSDHSMVKSILAESGLDASEWTLEKVSHAEMPRRLARAHAGLFFLIDGLSEHGCSPTKIGEYWSSGMPVVTTPNAGDSSDIARRERVGVVVEGDTEEAYARAAKELRALLDDHELGARCRRAAEEHYALGPACDRQMALYREVMSR